LVARFNPDRYPKGPARESRSMREFALLRWMAAMGLPVPIPVAARQRVVGRRSTADIMVGMIPNSKNLVQILAARPLNEPQWRNVGQAIRALHNAQVFHSDLNAHNILLDDNDNAWIVDFDKCETRANGSWKHENLKRLERSLRKELTRNPNLKWNPDKLVELENGYRSPPSSR
jgi:3-deoxy-D-manno-octulosonic-acid transferase